MTEEKLWNVIAPQVGCGPETFVLIHPKNEKPPTGFRIVGGPFAEAMASRVRFNRIALKSPFGKALRKFK